MKRAICFVLACALMLSLFSVAMAEESNAATSYDLAYFRAEMVGNATERVDAVTLADRTCYMYVPASNLVGNLLGYAPMLMVFGDEAFTEESVLTTVHETGFAQIAQREGACILFVNPIESWSSEADAQSAEALYTSFYEIYSSNPTLVFENGVATKVNAETGAETLVYPGSLFDVQLMGEGSGADYIAQNYLKAMPYVTNYGPQEGLAGMAPPCGVALFSPSAVALNTEETPLPIAIVNGPENAKEAAASYADSTVECMVVNDADAEGFDTDVLMNVYDTVVSRYNFAMTMYYVSPQYSLNGIMEVNGKTELSDGNTIEYYAYLPDGLSYDEAQSIPLVLYFHGWGGEGEAMLSWTNWPFVGQDNGFIVIAVDQHAGSNTTETMEWLDMMLAKYPFLDPSRIYSTGFSLGSSKTWNLGFKNAERFAAIMPTSLGVFPEGEESLMDFAKQDVILPVFYIGGGLSPLPELPQAGENANIVNDTLAVVWQFNHIGAYTFDETTGSRWGVKNDSERLIPSTDKGATQVLAVDSFESNDGITYTYLSINENKEHDASWHDSTVMWEYMSRFSRNADGSLSIAD